MTDPKKCTCTVCTVVNSMPEDMNSHQMADIMASMLLAYGVTPLSAVAILNGAAQTYANVHNAGQAEAFAGAAAIREGVVH